MNLHNGSKQIAKLSSLVVIAAGFLVLTMGLPVSALSAVPQNHAAFDFDGDGRADISVYRPSDGIWHVAGSTSGYSTTQWGLAADTIVPADYDGDGKTDHAVFRRGENSTWYILNSSTNTYSSERWGADNITQSMIFDRPVPADYDGDGKTDLAVWRFTDHLSEPARFLISQSLDKSARSVQWGGIQDTAVPADYDADGKTDLAVFRHSEGIWYILKSSDNSLSTRRFGLSSDKLVPADYDGDGAADVAVFRNGTWYVAQSGGQVWTTQFGLASDRLVPADYDGDGKTDVAVYRDGVWYLLETTGGFRVEFFGLAGDRPVPAM